MARIEAFEQLVGQWTTEATHPFFPGVIVRGQASISWLEGHKFLIVRESNDHPDFPDSISIIGDTDGMSMHYFDSRGVYRIYQTAITDRGWEFWRDDPEFSQRFVYRFEDGGNTVAGTGEMNKGEGWTEDLSKTYRRAR